MVLLFTLAHNIWKLYCKKIKKNRLCFSSFTKN